MKKLAGMLICAVMAAQMCVAAPAFAEEEAYGKEAYVVYVSASKGSDSGTGTSANPFRTVAQAQSAVRALAPDMQQDIVVELDAGTYFQSETLRFDERDSGQNGHRVIYRAAENEKAVISGGKRVENWQQGENGVWYADVDGPDIIREFYVNGTKRRLARTETKVAGQGYYTTPDDPDTHKGILLSRELLDGIEHPEDMVLHWSSAWMSYALLCEGIVAVDSEQSAALIQSDFQSLSSRETNPIRANAGLLLENAKKLMDQPGEFYYDRHVRRLYYIPVEGENMRTAEAVVPVLESVMEVRGSDSEHLVSGLDFRGLTFSHGAWYLPAQYGYNPVQAQWIYTADYETAFTPANISVSFARDIGFYGNHFTGLGCVGLGLHEMADDVSIVGNAFYDIKDSAISVGLPTHEVISEPEANYNVALNKPATSSSDAARKYRAEKAVTSLAPEVSWMPAASDGEPWIQVDLEEEYAVCGVALWFSQGGMNGGRVMLSNDPDFASGVTLSQQSMESTTLLGCYSPGEFPTTLYRYTANGGGKYRYARIFVQPGSSLNQLRVYDGERAGVYEEGSCSNTVISNNYITRIGDYDWAAPGITAYYVDNMKITHNHLQQLPYTAISVGWGWIYATASTTCHDNLIAENYIEDNMTECYDGGGIYTLGQQPGTRIERNYIRRDRFQYGVLYLDGGSTQITVTENVTEDTIAYFMNSPADGANEVFHNYVTSPRTTIQNPDTHVSDAVLYPIGMPTAEIWKVMNHAGLEKEYYGLLEQVPATPEGYDAFGSEGYINLTDTSGASAIKGVLLSDEISAAQIALDQAKVGDGLWEFSQEAIETFRTAVFRAQGIMNQTETGTAAEMYAEWEALRAAYQTFLASRNKLGYDELLARANNALASAEIGEGRGQYPQEAIDEFADYLENGIHYQKIEDPYLALEQAYLAFLEQGQTLRILGVELGSLIAEPEIDEEASRIILTVAPSTDLSRIVPRFILPEGCKLSDQTARISDFRSPVTLVVKNEEETAYRFWTVEFQKRAVTSFGT